jgi:hypothetical protein
MTMSVTSFRKDFKIQSISSEQSIASCDEADFDQSSSFSSSSASSANKQQLTTSDSFSFDSTDSSASSSSLISLKSSFSNLSTRFDSYKIRVNSLMEMFNMFLKNVCSSETLLKTCSYFLIFTISKYLQYSSNLNINHSENLDLLEIKKENESLSSSDDIAGIENDIKKETMENADSTTREYLFQERHYQITSNYSHLAKISKSCNSNTLVKPFLICLEKLLSILMNHRANIENLSWKDESMFQVYSYEIKDVKSEEITSQMVIFENTLEKYNLEHEEYEDILKNLVIEREIEFEELNQNMKLNLSLNDKLNKFKIICFLIHSLNQRIYLAFDELNSTQIVEYLYEFIKKLISSKEYFLASYCILEIVLKKIISIIDLLEFEKNTDSNESKLFKRSKKFDLKNEINKKLYENTFFMSSLMSKQIKKSVKLFSFLIESFMNSTACDLSDTTILKMFFNCILSRFISLLTKCFLRNLNSYDSIIDSTVIGFCLKNLYFSCIKLNNECMTLKCVKSLKLFHELSLIPCNNIIESYSTENKKNDEALLQNTNDEIQFEMLTTLCKYI